MDWVIQIYESISSCVVLIVKKQILSFSSPWTHLYQWNFSLSILQINISLFILSKFYSVIWLSVARFMKILHPLTQLCNFPPLVHFYTLHAQMWRKCFTNMKISFAQTFWSQSVIGCFLWLGKKLADCDTTRPSHIKETQTAALHIYLRWKIPFIKIYNCLHTDES